MANLIIIICRFVVCAGFLQLWKVIKAANVLSLVEVNSRYGNDATK